MELIEKIHSAGVVGCGGAGFPTHTKLNCKVEYLIINAAECEPFLKTDKYIMLNHTEEFINAVDAVAEHVHAEHRIIALKKTYSKEIEALNSAIAKLNSSIKLHLLDNFYPAGDEQVLVFEVTGRVVPPSGIPLNVGAVVSNVGTMLNIMDAINDKPVTHKYVTVTGEVNNPTLVKVPIGTSFRQCIEAAGGSTIKSYKVIAGGPLMGKVFNDSEIDNLMVTKTTSGIILIGDDNYIFTQSSVSIEHILNRAKSACIQCSFCTDMCPRNQIGHKIRPHRVMRHMAIASDPSQIEPDAVLQEALICSECGVCETFACPMRLSPRQVNIYVKKQLTAKGIRYDKKASDLQPSPLREYRKIPPKNIVARMGLSKFYDKAVNECIELDVKTVRIPLKQHIGAPAESVVKVGDVVEQGQLIANCDISKLGANIHASISGMVRNITDVIVIEREGV